jgi:two-component system chemotaxis sensor kinase CheA
MTEHDPVRTFLDEARDLLAKLEEALLALHADPGDVHSVARVFRNLHTIKGSGAMFGFTEIARFTHDLETAFDRVRSGDLPLTRELVDLTLQAKDHLQALLLADPSGGGLSAASDALLARFAHVLKEAGTTSGQAREHEPKPAGEPGDGGASGRPETSGSATGRPRTPSRPAATPWGSWRSWRPWASTPWSIIPARTSRSKPMIQRRPMVSGTWS